MCIFLTAVQSRYGLPQFLERILCAILCEQSLRPHQGVRPKWLLCCPQVLLSCQYIASVWFVLGTFMWLLIISLHFVSADKQLGYLSKCFSGTWSQSASSVIPKRLLPLFWKWSLWSALPGPLEPPYPWWLFTVKWLHFQGCFRKLAECPGMQFNRHGWLKTPQLSNCSLTKSPLAVTWVCILLTLALASWAIWFLLRF